MGASRTGKKQRTRRDRALYVEILIHAPMERVWELTQNPELHARWDGRFSRIVPRGTEPPVAFDYELDLGIARITGVGISLGDAHAGNGSRTSALRFAADTAWSPLQEGRGYWRYLPTDAGVRFITGYDYEPGWGAFGRICDRWITRRFVWWLTAWSFDRLRLWAEHGIEPERVRWWRLRAPRARASQCRSRPTAGTTGRNQSAAGTADSAGAAGSAGASGSAGTPARSAPSAPESPMAQAPAQLDALRLPQSVDRSPARGRRRKSAPAGGQDTA